MRQIAANQRPLERGNLIATLSGMETCICKTMAHGHGDHCERVATKPDGLCEECDSKMSMEARKLLEEEERAPLHLK